MLTNLVPMLNTAAAMAHPARIFMGDTGSLVLGFLLSIQAIALFQLSVITMTRSLELAFNPRLRTMV